MHYFCDFNNCCSLLHFAVCSLQVCCASTDFGLTSQLWRLSEFSIDLSGQHFEVMSQFFFIFPIISVSDQQTFVTLPHSHLALHPSTLPRLHLDKRESLFYPPSSFLDALTSLIIQLFYLHYLSLLKLHLTSVFAASYEFLETDHKTN